MTLWWSCLFMLLMHVSKETDLLLSASIVEMTWVTREDYILHM